SAVLFADASSRWEGWFNWFCLGFLEPQDRFFVVVEEFAASGGAAVTELSYTVYCYCTRALLPGAVCLFWVCFCGLLAACCCQSLT
ncbi:hypothetical protein Ancab_019308, partial [Ancistrocladus abbreviatus]